MRLIDRDRELAVLRRCILGDPGRRVAVVTGAPGIGKSALLRSMAAELGDGVRGGTVLTASGTPIGSGIAYGALRQLFGSLAAGLPDQAAPFDGPGAVLRGLVLGEPIDGDFAAVAYAVHWVTSSLSRDGGLVLVLDDAQWLDPVSGDAIAAALSLAAGESIVALAAIRESARDARTSAVAALYELADVVVVPRPLDDAAVEILLGVGPSTAARIRKLSGGVPFYVVELGAMIAAGDELGTPLRAIESIMTRLERLGSPALGVTRAVQTLGPDATPEFVAALAEIDRDELDRVARALVCEGVLAPLGADGELAVAHPLVGDAILADIGPAALGRLRDRACRLLHDAGVPSARVAAQLLLAEPTGESWHVEVLHSAAQEALAIGAEHEAVALVERALRETPAPADALALSDLAAAALLEAGRPGEAARLWERHLPQIAVELDRARRMMDIGDARYADGDYEAAEGAYRGSLDLLETLGFEPDSAPALEHAARFATARLTRSPLAEVIPSDVLDIVLNRPASAHGREERRFLAAAALSAHAREDWKLDPAALAERAYGGGAFAIPGFADDPTAYALSGSLYLAGRFDESLDLLDRAVDDARRRNRVVSEISARSSRGTTRILTGSLLAGVDDLDAAIGLGRLGTNTQLFQVSAFVHLIRYGSYVGDIDRSTALVAEFSALSLPGPLRALQLIGIAEHALASGAPEVAARAAARSRELDSEGVFAWTFSWRAAAAAAALALGDVRRATELNGEERYLLNRRRIPLSAQLESVLFTARLQPDPEAYETLREYAEGLPERHRWQRAVVAERIGELLLTSYPDLAHDHLLLALAGALEQGMSPLERRVRQRLRILGREPVPSSMERRIRSLTPSELRVAARAAVGVSNREIARELFVTLKTVEFHLGRTFRKLGITSRTELDAAFAEAGENAPPASA